jgi:hypothetical protein
MNRGKRCFAHQHGRGWPAKGSRETNALHCTPDWALRPVNNILCDGPAPGRHEWVTTMCATVGQEERLLAKRRVCGKLRVRIFGGMAKVSKGGKSRASDRRRPPEARCAFGAPLTWLFLIGLRPPGTVRSMVGPTPLHQAHPYYRMNEAALAASPKNPTPGLD